MITRILKSRGSTSAVVKYNEDKVAAGKAELVLSNEMLSESIADIYRTLEEYEENPAIRNNVKNVAFHMTVDPGPEDECSEEDVLRYVQKVMKGLGYENQPYAVYRHEDIERKHYHIASVRVNAEGKAIPDHFEKRRVNQMQKEYATEFHFHAGLNKEKDENLTVPKKLTYGEYRWPTKAIMIVQETARKEHFTSMEQLQDILKKRNVGIKQTQYDGKKYERVMVYATDDNGKSASSMINVERDFDVDLYAQIKKAMEKNIKAEKKRNKNNNNNKNNLKA